MIFFTDRDLGKSFPEILSAAGFQVERHADHFADDAPDQEWLEAIGKQGWVAITHDRRIRYKPNEQVAVLKHDVRILIVIGKAPFPKLAHSFVATRDRIERFIAANDAPFIAKVHRPTAAELSRRPDAPGRVSLWLPHA